MGEESLLRDKSEMQPMIGRAKVMDVVAWTRRCCISSLDFEREKGNIVERELTLGDDALGFVESLFFSFSS